MVGSKYRYFDPKNRPFTVFFTIKRYRSINIGSINFNTNIKPPGLFNLRIKVLNSEVRSSVKGHYSAVTAEPPTE